MRRVAWRSGLALALSVGLAAAPVVPTASEEAGDVADTKPFEFFATSHFQGIDCQVLLYFHNGLERGTVTELDGPLRIGFFSQRSYVPGYFHFADVAPGESADPSSIRVEGHGCEDVRYLRLVATDACEIDGAARDGCVELMRSPPDSPVALRFGRAR